MQSLFRRSSARRGFSLIEQVVAVASVAVIAAVVMPNVVSQLGKSEVGRMQQDLQTVEKGIKDFRVDVGYWPGNLLQLKDALSGTQLDPFGTPIVTTVYALWKGPYFEPKAFVEVEPGIYRMTSAAGTYFTNELGYLDWAPKKDGLTLMSHNRYITVQLNKVEYGDARELSRAIDGTDDLGTGRVRWSGPVGSNGTLTYLAGPIN